MNPIPAAVAGALISGVAMYAVGARTPQVDAFSQTPTVIETEDGQYVTTTQPMRYATALQTTPANTPVVRRVSNRTTAARRTVARQPANEVYAEERADGDRTWTKSAMIIGGSAASGAGVGGLIKGKKGALIGAAIGGGAATIYEATRRR
jgi:hypothetical protein